MPARSRRSNAIPGALLLLGLAAGCARATAPAEPGPSPEAALMVEATTVVAQATGAMPEARGVEVSFVRLTQERERTWRLEVTLRHPAATPDDQVSGWSVLLPDGAVAQAGPSGQTQDIPPRQPPLRSITDARSGVELPAGVSVIVVRGHTSGGAPSGREVTVDLGLDRGPGFSIVHTY